MTILRLYPFLIPLVVGLLCEAVKVTKEGIQTGRWHEGLFRSGGMPSTHSAFVMSLLMVIGYKLGFRSGEFAIAFVFACITWYDAMNARRAIGAQAEILNRMQQWKHFSERVGHSFKEVLGGVVFGAVVTWLGIVLAG